MKKLVENVIRDINQNPEKGRIYLAAFMNKGLITPQDVRDFYRCRQLVQHGVVFAKNKAKR